MASFGLSLFIHLFNYLLSNPSGILSVYCYSEIIMV